MLAQAPDSAVFDPLWFQSTACVLLVPSAGVEQRHDVGHQGFELGPIELGAADLLKPGDIPDNR